MPNYDVYGSIAFEGLSCGLAVAGLAVELATTAAAPPVGALAAAGITVTTLAATSNCTIFIAHMAATTTSSLSNPTSEKHFENASQLVGSLSSVPSALNSIGYLTGNSQFNDVAAIATAGEMLKRPGSTTLERFTHAVESVRGFMDINSRLEERAKEKHTAISKSTPKSPDNQDIIKERGASASNNTTASGNPPTVCAPAATESNDSQKTEPLPTTERPTENQSIHTPVGHEKNYQDGTFQMRLP